MKRYRIVKKSWINYPETCPTRESHYVIQRKICFFWFNLTFDNYPDSLMCFDSLKKAKEYRRELLDLIKYNGGKK